MWLSRADSPTVGALQIVGLWSILGVQPLFSLLCAQTQILVVRHLEPGDLLTFTLIWCLAAPLPLVLTRSAAELLGSRVGAACQVLLVFGLNLLAGLLALRPSGLPGPLALTIATVLAGLFTTAYVRHAALRVATTASALLALLMPLFFLLATPISTVLFPATGVTMGGPVPSRTPVVVVLLDELPVFSLLDPEGNVDATTFPNFADLAAHSTWYTEATTVADFTENAVPAVVTGRYPQKGQLPDLNSHPHNLFTLLGGSYELKIVEMLTRLAPPSLVVNVKDSRSERLRSLLRDSGILYLHLLLPSDLAPWLPEVGQQWKDFGLGATAEDSRELYFRDFVASIGPSAEPTLYFLHVLLPHYPYQYLPSGKRYFTHERVEVDGGEWKTLPFGGNSFFWPDRWSAEEAYQRHLLQLGCVDLLLGELLDTLRSSGLFDSCLLVVAADHGASFRPETPHRRFNPANVAEVMRVPLFIKRPFQSQPERVGGVAETVDIVPTIADLLGIEQPWPMDGRSLREGAKETPRVVFSRDKTYEVAAQRLAGEASLRHKFATFGFPLDLFRVGPDPKWRGTSLADLPRGDPAPAVVEVDYPELFMRVDPASQDVPARVSGVLRFASPAARPDVAVAVNGVVQAVVKARPSRDQGRTYRWGAMVPEASLRAGANELSFLLLEHDLFRSVATAAARGYALDGDQLVTPEGDRLPLRPQSIQGRLDEVVARPDRVILKGWAADVAGARPADTIVFFEGDRFLLEGRTGRGRRDIADRFQKPALHVSGFVEEIPTSAAPLELTRLRAFAVLDGVAVELPR